ncbi:unnamed protein product [Rotaria sordida]|uniref:Cullin family profile domain-containing protein n=2 Tax=Rotaria sordida TaxID=392033 RepID=A0A819PJI8_9BILA|nr:unnamed protein product [Rotaria sordida]CAF4011689.1 unnamed protein product [Rotaria sordida]
MVNEGRRGIYEIDKLAKQVWKEIFFIPLFTCVRKTCLNLIKEHRNKKLPINTQLIKNIIELYSKNFVLVNENFKNQIIELIINGSRSESINDMYGQYFEIEFLQDIEDFYRQQNIPSLESTSMIESLTQISEYFDQEINFGKSFLPESKSTLQILINKLEEIFLPNHYLNSIMDQMKIIVSTENSQDLRVLYKLVSPFPKIKDEVVQLIENHIYKFGANTIERISGISIDDPKLYVETIIDIHKKYSDIFDVGPVFKAALDKACGKFINNNAITEKADTKTKSPELLARYCNTLLKKRNKTMEEINLDKKFNEILIVFNYIEDKDVYAKFYGKMLAKRLVDQLSVSNDDEKLIISKLKQTCGFEYTSKFEQMIQDIDISKTLIDQYRMDCKNKNLKDIVDFSVMVLRSNSRSFSPLPNIILPIELKATFDSFKDFYNCRHNGRKLILLHQYSKGEIQRFFTKQKYTLQVSIYQMIVLLLFNEELNWTVEQIKAKTQIKTELLHQVLVSLLKSKILFSKEITEDFQDSNIKMNHKIELTEDFISENLRVNLNVGLKSTKQKDLEYLNESIDEDRKFVIQAAIVRIMKERQNLKYSLLIKEIIEQLSLRFKPKVSLIKKCIDLLIEKEYLQRDVNDKDILHYVT